MARRAIEGYLKQLIAVNLSRVRKAKGLTQEQLAHRLQMTSVRRIVAYESGKSNLTLDTIEHIAKELDVHPSELLTDPRLLDQSKASLAEFGIELLKGYLATSTRATGPKDRP
jgi:transcriptional regulator with XRE-family HTH domain